MAVKPHIGIYGRCNAGKSTLINLLIGADMAIVSSEAGTTTDPVRKAMEILGFAPVVLIDTAGVDDTSPLGELRRGKTYDTIADIDMAIIVTVGEWGKPEEELVRRLSDMETPYIVVENGMGICRFTHSGDVLIDHLDETERNSVLAAIRETLPESSYIVPSLLGDQVSAGDVVVMVCPIDSEAPSGRLILPQVQTLREALDQRVVSIVIQPESLPKVFCLGLQPRIVITDSQIFDVVRSQTPASIPVTSFSILMARVKGDEVVYRRSLEAVDSLAENDRILICENCTHQHSCEDIGRVKIPRWLEEYTGKKIRFDFVSGRVPLPDNLSEYALIVQCGGCMANRRTIQNRIRRAVAVGVPITNYGMLIKKIIVKK